MARLMSFALTREQILDHTKTVTRRTGWKQLVVGERLIACTKVMGRRNGEPLERLAEIRVVSLRRENLRDITDADVAREGFPGRSAADFIEMFSAAMGASPVTMVSRIEFEYLSPRTGRPLSAG
jgi:hypothetical protein